MMPRTAVMEAGQAGDTRVMRIRNCTHDVAMRQARWSVPGTHNTSRAHRLTQCIRVVDLTLSVFQLVVSRASSAQPVGAGSATTCTHDTGSSGCDGGQSHNRAQEGNHQCRPRHGYNGTAVTWSSINVLVKVGGLLRGARRAPKTRHERCGMEIVDVCLKSKHLFVRTSVETPAPGCV